MLCQKCKKNQASYYYKQTVNGVTSETALCSECAQKYGAGSGLSFSSSPSIFGGGLLGNDIFGGLFSPFGHGIYADEKKCTLCGLTFEDIKRAGKVGCAKCYEVFERELSPTVASIHGNVSHVGRRPKNKA